MRRAPVVQQLPQRLRLPLVATYQGYKAVNRANIPDTFDQTAVPTGTYTGSDVLIKEGLGAQAEGEWQYR